MKKIKEIRTKLLEYFWDKYADEGDKYHRAAMESQIKVMEILSKFNPPYQPPNPHVDMKKEKKKIELCKHGNRADNCGNCGLEEAGMEKMAKVREELKWKYEQLMVELRRDCNNKIRKSLLAMIKDMKSKQYEARTILDAVVDNLLFNKFED